MFRRQLLIGVSTLSTAAFGPSSMTYARESEPNDNRGSDRLVEVQAGDDRGVDAAVQS